MKASRETRPEPTLPPRQRSRLATLSVRAGMVGGSLLVALLAAELVWRWRGERPWNPPTLDIRVDPGGKLFRTDPRYGYALLPGRFRITLETGHSYTATHNAEGYRVTSLAAQSAAEQAVSAGAIRATDERPTIWVFGCSFAYGYSVDDEQSFPWILSGLRPEWRVSNFGVPGYGTIHSVRQCEDLLAQGKRAKRAVLAYFSFHDERNTFSRTRRKLLAHYSRLGPMGQPYARLTASGELVYGFDQVVYREFPLMRWSALIHSAEQAYDEAEHTWLQSHAVSLALMLRWAELCRQHGIEPLVTTISPSPLSEHARGYCLEHGVPAVDIAFDWEVDEFWNAPADPFHPSPLGYRLLAENLHRALGAAESAPANPAGVPRPAGQ